MREYVYLTVKFAGQIDVVIPHATFLFLQAKYHKDFEMSGLHGVPPVTQGPYLVHAQTRPNHETAGNGTHKGVHQYIMEMDRRPGVIVGKFILHS